MTKRKLNSFLCLGILFILPFTVLAEAPSDFKGVVLIIVDVLTAVLPVIVLLAFIYFIWGLTQYLKADNKEKSEAQAVMTNGIIALFMIVGVWGFVWILARTFIGEATYTNTPDGFYEIRTTDWSEEIPKIKFDDKEPNQPNPDPGDPVIAPPF